MQSLKNIKKNECFFQGMDPEIRLNLAINILNFLSVVLHDYQPAEESKKVNIGKLKIIILYILRE